MRVAIINDTHFGARNDAQVFLTYLAESSQWFFDILDKEGIKHVLHLGDLYDRRKYVNFVTAKYCREHFLEPLVKRNIETHIISGNHDHFYKNTWKMNSLDELITGRFPNIHTYHKSQTINISGLDICLIPWINEENALSTYSEIKNTKAEIVMGHLELKGFEEIKGVISQHGQDKKIYDKFDMVLSGHFHHKSSVGSIHYLGAFAEFTWSDHKGERGFHIFDTDTRKLEFFQNPYHIFKMIGYDDTKITKEEIKASDYSEFKESYVKVVCTSKSDPFMFDMFLEKLYKVSPIDISVIEEVTTLIENDQEAIDQTEDTPKILSTYIDGLKLPVDNFEMKKYMQELYSEAISKEHVQ